jgi:hypothetical protein
MEKHHSMRCGKANGIKIWYLSDMMAQKQKKEGEQLKVPLELVLRSVTLRHRFDKLVNTVYWKNMVSHQIDSDVGNGGDLWDTEF